MLGALERPGLALHTVGQEANRAPPDVHAPGPPLTDALAPVGKLVAGHALEANPGLLAQLHDGRRSRGRCLCSRALDAAGPLPSTRTQCSERHEDITEVAGHAVVRVQVPRAMLDMQAGTGISRS